MKRAVPGSRLSPAIIVGALRLADAAVLAAAAFLAHYTRYGTLDLPSRDLVALAIALFLMANVMQAAKLYEFAELARVMGQINRLFVALPTVLLGLLALGFATKTSGEFSRVWIATWFVYAFVGLIGLRVVLALVVRRWRAQGRFARTVVVVGAGEPARELCRRLNEAPEGGAKLLGLFTAGEPAEAACAGAPVLGTVDEVLAFSRTRRIDQAVVALPPEAGELLESVLGKLKTLPCPVAVRPAWLGERFRPRGVGEVGGLPVLTVFERPLSGWAFLVKAAEDRVLGLLLLVLFAPVMLLIALLIVLDDGPPVLFRQRRYGFNNELITVHKFRTMRAGRGPEPEVPQAVPGDPRVTRIGRLLRAASLDELPQLFDVLAGAMSLVGPRPHAVPHNEKYAELVDQYLVRHRVKPGITGWAQVNGLRGATETVAKMQERVAYDLYYIDNWSLLFDLRILAMTAFVVLLGKNAY